MPLMPMPPMPTKWICAGRERKRLMGAHYALSPPGLPGRSVRKEEGTMATARRVCHGLPVSDPPPGPPSAARVAVATVSAAAIALAAAPTLGRPWVGLLPPALLLLAYGSHARAQVQARNAAIVAAATALTLLLPPGWWGWPAPL